MFMTNYASISPLLSPALTSFPQPKQEASSGVHGNEINRILTAHSDGILILLTTEAEATQKMVIQSWKSSDEYWDAAVG